MDKQEAKRRELIELGKEEAAEENEIRLKYGGKTKGQDTFARELLPLREKYKAKYIAICEKYK